jgi:hypothetical protein
MRESCTSGSVRGASSDRRLYSTLRQQAPRTMAASLAGALNLRPPQGGRASPESGMLDTIPFDLFNHAADFLQDATALPNRPFRQALCEAGDQPS